MNFRVRSTTETFRKWEELGTGTRGLELKRILVFVDFTVKGVGGCFKGRAVA